MIWEKRRRNGKILLNCTAGVAGLLLAGTKAWGQANMLGNPGFENPVLAPNTDMPMSNNLTGGTPIASWSGWNNETTPYSAYFDDNVTAHSGNQVGKTYGGQTYSGNGPNAGIYQPVAATPGDSYTANGWYVNSSVDGGADQLNNNETDDCRIFFDTGANGTGTQIGNPIVSSTTVNETTPTDVWTQLNTIGVAPVGAQSVIWMAFYSCPVEFAAGALYVDDAYLGYSPLTWNNSGGSGDGASWDVNTNQNWSDGTEEALFPNGAPVTFNDNNGGHYSVNVTSPVQPWSTTFSATGNYTLSGTGGIGGAGSLTQSGSGTVTLATPNTYSGGTFVTNGTLKIAPTGSTISALPTGPLPISGSGAVKLADNVTAGTALGTSNVNITSLSITGTGTLDIGNNRIIVDYTTGNDPIASIALWIKNGFYDLAGPQIISSDIAADDAASHLSYGIGYADGADGVVAGLPSGEIEIMFTLLGDANLDGIVNSEDFTPFSANVGKNGSWDQGDFNYDGTVNSEDFTPFSANLGKSASLAAAAGGLEVANGISLANVPEPACGSLLLVGVASLLSRRSRRRCGPA